MVAGSGFNEGPGALRKVRSIRIDGREVGCGHAEHGVEEAAVTYEREAAVIRNVQPIRVHTSPKSAAKCIAQGHRPAPPMLSKSGRAKPNEAIKCGWCGAHFGRCSPADIITCRPRRCNSIVQYAPSLIGASVVSGAITLLGCVN